MRISSPEVENGAAGLPTSNGESRGPDDRRQNFGLIGNLPKVPKGALTSSSLLRFFVGVYRSMFGRRRVAAQKGAVEPPAPIRFQDPLNTTDLMRLLDLVNSRSQPNINALRIIANSIEPISFNIKQMGYSLARQLAAAMPPPAETRARHVGLSSSLSTQESIESDWVAHWCRQLGVPVVYHRKIWELCFVLQALHETGMLEAGKRGLGFGCGTEPLPSYFAALDIDVTATDLPPDAAAESGWVQTGQHTSMLDTAYMEHLVGREVFDQRVSLRFLDMNAIPDDLTGYDFCWSICALEHLGSIGQGINFIENSLRTLRPGGTAVHTTEYNIREEGPTIDNWPTVAFQRKHMEALAERLEGQGHKVSPFDFSLGEKPLDRFVDVPPYHHDLPSEMQRWLGEPAHLKLALDGLVVTCIGLKIEKGGIDSSGS